MTIPHQQAVQMAEAMRDHGSHPELRLFAYDIETHQLAQLAQIGQMRGRLQA